MADEQHSRSLWLTIEGVALIVLGIAALIAPLIAGIATAILLGWLLIMAGVVGLASAIGGRARSHMGWSIVSALIAVVVGVLLLLSPVVGTIWLSLLVAAYLLLDGVALVALSFDHQKRAAKSWGWLLASGFLDIALAALIVVLSAVGAAVFIGIIVGIDLIAAGFALIMLGRATRPAVAA
jgi:uncharacterized membrane protein HdeD (DUF308 family)